MGITTVSSREFNQDVSRVKRAAVNGPVFRTDRGHPSHVLLTIEEYQKITGKKESIVELLAECTCFTPCFQNAFLTSILLLSNIAPSCMCLILDLIETGYLPRLSKYSKFKCILISRLMDSSRLNNRLKVIENRC